MPPKKRRNVSEDKNVKAKKLSKSSEIELVASNSKNNQTRLSFLPVDVLLYIYKFLSPVDLLSLSQLSDPKFSDLTDVQRKVNFSLCRKANFELVSSYFSRERTKNIQKLNFNYCAFAKPCDLVKIICRCKNLIVLSIVECGIKYEHVIKIANNCTNLKELTWNVNEGALVKNTDNCIFPNVTKLFLFCDVMNKNTIHVIHVSFPKVESAIICYCSCYLIAPPFIGTWTRSATAASTDKLRQCTVLKNFYKTQDRFYYLKLKSEFKVPFNTVNNQNMCYYNYPPYLKLQTKEEDLSTLSKCNSNTYSSVVIVLTQAFTRLYERFLARILKVAGSKLKYLTFDFEEPTRSDSVLEVHHELYANVIDMFDAIFRNCQNITVLNVSTVHFSSETPFKAMCHLKNLRALSIPSCAFCELWAEPFNKKKLGEGEISDFEEMTLNCWKVEEFHLKCCLNEVGVIDDTDIFPMKNWKTLKSLTIFTAMFKKCRFLRMVADSCSDFHSFSLISTYSKIRCIFYDDVIYLLKNAKNLCFIRINDKRFNPEFERFWSAISSAKNLEGICFLTEYNTVFNTSTIIKSIKSLQYLHLFHFGVQRVSENLSSKVRISMVENGIKNPKIETVCLDTYHPNREFEINDCYHLKPVYSCKHLHLTPCLFDFITE